MANPRGRPPKNPEDRARYRVTEPAANKFIKLPPWDGKTRGPSLGRYNPQGLEWHKLTLKWWKTWRQSPQAMFMTATDWEALFLGALMHDRMMKGCSDTALANLDSGVRRREDAVGSSIEARIRLGMTSEDVEETVTEAKIEQGVREIVDYTARLGKRVGGGDLGST